VAASVATIAFVAVFSRDAVGDRPPQQLAVASDVVLPAMPVPIVAKPAGPSPRRAVGATPRPSVGASRPEVLLSATEQAGVRLLFETAASGRLQLPPEMLHDLPLAFASGDGPTEGATQ
jgi:hypothetical protein